MLWLEGKQSVKTGQTHPQMWASYSSDRVVPFLCAYVTVFRPASHDSTRPTTDTDNPLKSGRALHGVDLRDYGVDRAEAKMCQMADVLFLAHF